MENVAQFFKNIFMLIEKYILLRFETFGISDIFDILILTVIFYFVYLFISDRRAGKLAFGLLLIFGFFILSSIFNLTSVKMIFQNFFQAGILALLILFQPELRAALEKVGSTPIQKILNISGDVKNTALATKAVNEITEAVCDLSMEKTGALIVLERTTKLGDYIKTGTIINAEITSNLIKNLFYNKAPLHDGAVIVRDYHIYSAGSFLPLSTNKDIISDLGTRHRAAIGISELSDALVIVVSEETGNISIASEGTLKRNFNYRTLKNALTKAIVPSNDNHTKNVKVKGTKQKKENSDND